jgi:hypothetical protein
MVVFIGNLLGTELAVRIFRTKIKYIGNGSFFLQKNPIKDKLNYICLRSAREAKSLSSIYSWKKTSKLTKWDRHEIRRRNK